MQVREFSKGTRSNAEIDRLLDKVIEMSTGEVDRAAADWGCRTGVRNAIIETLHWVRGGNYTAYGIAPEERRTKRQDRRTT